MIESVRDVLNRLGGREATLDSCPVCGRAVTASEDRVRVWQGKIAHRDCAQYSSRTRARRSQRVHK